MKPAPVGYVRPTTVEEACAALAADAGAKVLAGGQSLVPLLSMRLAAPTTLVDVNRLPGLDTVTVEASGVRVGALVRHAALLADEAAAAAQPLLRMTLSHVAHPAIRNRGTVVGSLAHADAAAELPAVLALVGGSLEAASTSGTRTIPAGELFAGPLESTLAHEELATSAWFPALPADTGAAFDEVSRRRGDYALCGVAATVRVVDGYVVAARAAYVAVCDVPTVVDLTAALTGTPVAAGRPDESALAAAADLADAAIDPTGDIHATEAYRRQLARVLTGRVLGAAYDHAVARAAGGTAR